MVFNTKELAEMAQQFMVLTGAIGTVAVPMYKVIRKYQQKLSTMTCDNVKQTEEIKASIADRQKIWETIGELLRLAQGNKEANLALLHFAIYEMCERIQRVGSMTRSEAEDLDHLYNAYHGLGGNGTGTRLYEYTKGIKIYSEKGGKINE